MLGADEITVLVAAWQALEGYRLDELSAQIAGAWVGEGARFVRVRYENRTDGQALVIELEDSSGINLSEFPASWLPPIDPPSDPPPDGGDGS